MKNKVCAALIVIGALLFGWLYFSSMAYPLGIGSRIDLVKINPCAVEQKK